MPSAPEHATKPAEVLMLKEAPMPEQAPMSA
jgi:hypothetical protein